MKKNSIFFLLLFFSLILWLYRNWFLTSDIIGGDWPYLYPSMLKDFSGFVQLWSAQVGRGFGGINVNQSLYSYLHVTIVLANLTHLPWQILYKIFWFGLFIFLSFFSTLSLLKKITGNSISLFARCCGAFFYTTNTYILMVAVGGQMGVSLAYAVVPLVISLLYTSLQNLALIKKKSNCKSAIVDGITFGLAYALLAFFDVRIAYLVFYLLLLFTAYYYFLIHRYELKQFSVFSLIAIGSLIVLHVYWIFPLMFFGGGEIPQEISSSKSFAFFSFADFSHAFSLLHPNWPDNIFGKTSFLRPEFLFLPLLAFSGLLFINKDKNKKNLTYFYLFFCLLSLIAIFFAKGAREPFAFVNTFVFEHVPGMGIFRDSTKFYFFSALGFSIQITMSISMMYGFFIKNPKPKFYSLSIVYAIFLICWLAMIWPFSAGELSGTFTQKQIPLQYKELDRLVNGSPNFFRTLWIPEQSRYRVQSELHPLLNGTTYFKTTNRNTILKKLSVSKNILSDGGVKYVIVPYDADREIFVHDRKYNDAFRQSYIKEIDKIPWLNKIYDNKLTIYENAIYKDHAYLAKGGVSSVVRRDNSNYVIAVTTNSQQSLYFMEEYSPYWKATIDSKSEATIYRTDYGTMRIEVPRGQSKVSFVYTPQQIYVILQIFSFLSLIFLLLMVGVLKISNKKLKA